MKAVVHAEYGPPEVLQIREIGEPVPKDDEVLVRVRAASVHPGDWMLMTGRPYVMCLGTGLRRPRRRVPGFDLAGYIEGVGKNVSEISIGDEVFGKGNGTCAEYAVASKDAMAAKPANLTLEQSAAVPVSGITALRAVRDRAEVGPGRKVLVNGASGGVGTFAVQIAKAYGAEVTGVCITGNVDLVRSIGADHVIDYTVEDFTRGGKRYDLILDNAGSHSLADLRRVLTSDGKLIPDNGTAGGRWFGTLGRTLGALLLSTFVSRQGRPFISIEKKKYLAALRELIESGRVTPVVGSTYRLDETPEAMAEIGGGHARGKTVIVVGR